MHAEHIPTVPACTIEGRSGQERLSAVPVRLRDAVLAALARLAGVPDLGDRPELLNLGDPDAPDPAGHYRLVGAGVALHVAIRPQVDLEQMRLARRVALLADRAGVAGAVPLATEGGDSWVALPVPGTWFMQASPHLEHTTYSGSAREFAAAAAALSRLHRALRDAPAALRDAVRRRNRVQRESARRAHALLGSLPAGPDMFEMAPWVEAHRAALAEVHAAYDPGHPLRGEAHVLHGDLHPANVGFCGGGGAAVFFDFEESAQSFGTPLLDMAKLAVRLHLLHPGADAPENFPAFLRAYGVAEQDVPALCAAGSQAWRQLVCDNIARALLACRERTHLVPIEEFDKYLGYFSRDLPSFFRCAERT